MPLAEAVNDPTPDDLAALAMDRLPLAVIVVDRITRTIRYANAAAKMRGAACDMPVPGAVLDPARIACDQAVPVPLGDGDVPMTATLLPGDAGLLLVEQPAQVAEAAKLLQMIDGMPVAVMTADPQDDFRINYLNRTSREIMRRVEAHLPVEADALLGKSIDVFHAHARHQRALLADPANLPFKTRIKVGNELLSLEATAIMATDGRYLGPMVTWKLVTEEARLSNDVGAMATALASSFEQLNQQAAGLRTRAQTKARVVSELSGAAQHMDNLLNHISRHVAHAGMLASQINEQAGATTRVVQSLEESAEQIERMSTAIGRIATQTNLLALNATIEAARAGDAGRGFGVVASEVKALATETARANADISLQISGMRNATTAAAAAMRAIKVEIGELAEAATEVQRANDQQADSAAAVNRSVAEVRVAAEETDVAADVVSGLANDLSSHAQGLRQKLGSVLG